MNSQWFTIDCVRHITCVHQMCQMCFALAWARKGVLLTMTDANTTRLRLFRNDKICVFNTSIILIWLICIYFIIAASVSELAAKKGNNKDNIHVPRTTYRTLLFYRQTWFVSVLKFVRISWHSFRMLSLIHCFLLKNYAKDIYWHVPDHIRFARSPKLTSLIIICMQIPSLSHFQDAHHQSRKSTEQQNNYWHHRKTYMINLLAWNLLLCQLIIGFTSQNHDLYWARKYLWYAYHSHTLTYMYDSAGYLDWRTNSQINHEWDKYAEFQLTMTHAHGGIIG